MQYYVIAVPLTNYCEEKAKSVKDLSHFATPYKSLEVEKMHDDLRKIKTEKDIEKYLKKYEWVKTAYNLIENYTKEEVKEELKKVTKKTNIKKKSIPKSVLPYVVGLQVGIYLRNRMKELAQKLWFYVDPLAISMAADLGISRDEFLQMRYSK